MACYHPLTAFWTGALTESGKKELILVHGDCDRLDINSASIPDRFKQNIKPFSAATTIMDGHIYLTQKLELPCGQCIGCRLDYARQWALRCMLEAKQWKDNIFLTLTYDDEHLTSASLVPEDLTKFMKDLRRQWQYHYGIDEIRFFACGEYGELYTRPHFHIIVFNCPVPDKKLFKTFRGVRYYESDHISRIWDKGFITIGEVTFESCAYVARYVIKKQKGKGSKEYYENLGVMPEFVRMSRRPGIAREWYEANKDKIYETDEIFLSDGKGNLRQLKPARYFDRLYDNYKPEQLEEVKARRRVAGELTRQNKMYNLGITDRNEFLAREEELATVRISNSTRSKIKRKEKQL